MKFVISQESIRKLVVQRQKSIRKLVVGIRKLVVSESKKACNPLPARDTERWKIN